MLKNPVFLCKVKIPSQQFSQFHEHFQKQSFADVLQNRYLQYSEVKKKKKYRTHL